MEFNTKAAIKISTKDGDKHVPALIHDHSPGLAVTMSVFGYFTVTHINTGMSMCSAYERFSSALLVLSEFALIAKDGNFSWESVDTDSAKNVLSDRGSNPVPFDGSTVTENGETRKMTISEWVKSLRMIGWGGVVDEFPWEESDNSALAVENLEKAQCN